MKDTLIEQFLDVVARFPKKEALLFRTNHHFSKITYEEIYKYAQNLAIYLKEAGVREGENIVLYSANRPEWVIVDVASLILGTVLVPIHSVLAPAQVKSILEETNPTFIFVDTPESSQKIIEAGLNDATTVVVFEDLGKNSKAVSFKEKAYDPHYKKTLEPISHRPERLVSIIYTSGTTGKFKGAMLTNRNFISNIEGVLSWVEVTETDTFLSILPLSHVFERTVGYYIPLMRGATISYVEDSTKLAEYAKGSKPTIIIGVPRLYEKVYQGVMEKAAVNPAKKIIFSLALKIGQKLPKDTLLYKVADKVVFGKIKEAFGGKLRFFVSGAASLPKEIGKFFDALNIPVLEGYGLTETSPIISTNTLSGRRYGTVGRALPNLRIKTAKNGELLVKGPSVFGGYYKNPERTKEVFTGDGWFKTGDLVSVDKNGYISFKAREKEIIALSTGKKVSPAYLEEKLESIPEISQAFVFGDGRKHVGALIVPEFKKLKGKTKKQLSETLLKLIVEAVNPKVSHYEQIKKFVIVKHPFSVENNLLTPTLKLRRKEITEKYRKEIDSIYTD